MVQLADEQFGAGYLTEGDVHRCTPRGSGFTLVAVDQDRMVGFALCRLPSREELRKMLRIPLPDGSEPDGVLRTIAVRPGYQRQDVGQSLVQSALTQFRALGAGTVYTVAWKRRGAVPLRGVLTGARFTRLAKVRDYWTTASLAEGFACVSCGTPPCRCTAVVYAHADR